MTGSHTYARNVDTDGEDQQVEAPALQLLGSTVERSLPEALARPRARPP